MATDYGFGIHETGRPLSFGDYKDLLSQGQKWVADAQKNDPAYQAWYNDQQANWNTLDTYGQGPAWNGRDFWGDWRKTLAPEVAADFNRHMSDSKDWGDSVGKVLKIGIPLAVGGAAMFGGPGLGSLFGAGEAAGAGAIGADAATSAAWGSGAGLGGDTLGAMGLGETLGASSAPATWGGSGSLLGGGIGGTGSGLGVPGLNVGAGLSGTGSGLSATSGLTGFGSTVGSGAAAGGAVANFLKGLVPTSVGQGFNLARSVSSLAGLYSNYKQNKNLSSLASNLAGLYKPGSAYEEQLRKELARRDAAAGRRSQYGPRSVELQARLAEMATRNAPALAQIYTQQGNAQNNVMKDILDFGNYSGGFKYLSDLFGG